MTKRMVEAFRMIDYPYGDNHPDYNNRKIDISDGTASTEFSMAGISIIVGIHKSGIIGFGVSEDDTDEYTDDIIGNFNGNPITLFSVIISLIPVLLDAQPNPPKLLYVRGKDTKRHDLYMNMMKTKSIQRILNQLDYLVDIDGDQIIIDVAGNLNESLNEAVVKVPADWVNRVGGELDNLLKMTIALVFPTIFTEPDKDIEEYINENLEELGYDGYRPLDERFIENGKSYLYVKDPIILTDDKNETFVSEVSFHLGINTSSTSDVGGMVSEHPSLGVVLMINPVVSVMEALSRAGIGATVPKVYQYAKHAMFTTIEHELTHVIQKSKSKTPQMKTNVNYDKDKTEYFKSPVEFNAQIISQIRDLEGLLSDLTHHQKQSMGMDNLKNAILNHLGDTTKGYKPTGVEEIDSVGEFFYDEISEPNHFMYTLRDHKPTAWKKAMKAILKYFENKHGIQ